MNARVPSRQVLQWIIRHSTSSLFSPHHSGRWLRRPCVQSRLCSSLLTTSTSHDPVPPQRDTALSLQCLSDMGFTDSQAEEIYESVTNPATAKHCSSTLTALFVLGLNPSSVVKLLSKCPELYTTKESLLQQRITNLRKLGLKEGSLQRVVAHYPAILTVPVKTVKHVVMVLREKCLFTGQQATDILRDSPAVVLEDLTQLQYKFQYVYFRMGVKQSEMVKNKLFGFSLDDLRCRHCFLERRGLYQTPDKKGHTTIINPKLDSILNVSLDTFLTVVAQVASMEEYDVFQRLMAREWQEEERHHGDVQAESDEDEEEEEEEEDDFEGKDSYRKRKKRI